MGRADSTVRFSNAEKSLVVALGVYVILDVLLTPPAGIETRDPAKVTGIGIAGLALLFIGLGLSIAAIVMLFRRSKWSPHVAIVAAILFLPAFLSEQTGRFSALAPPTGIEVIEWVQALVVVVTIGLGIAVLRAHRQ
jgi:hypothetical protein